MTTVQAIAPKLRVSPRKANLVLGLIRGKQVFDAMNELKFCKRRISDDINKLLLAAVSNAENNNGLDADDLIVSQAFVGKESTLKRHRCRARGRVGKILKHNSRVTIVLSEKGES